MQAVIGSAYVAHYNSTDGAAQLQPSFPEKLRVVTIDFSRNDLISELSFLLINLVCWQ